MDEHRADEHRGNSDSRPSLYEELFEQSVDGILLIENDRILHANRALCGQLGYVLDGLIGSNPIDLIHPADRPEAQTRLRALGRGEAVKNPQLYRTLHRDGSALWMEATSRRITWEGRQVVQTIVCDISTRHQFEGALRESETRYRDLFDSVPVGLYRTTPEGQIVDANPALVEMLGYPDRETLMPIPARDVYVSNQVRDELAERVQREEVIESFESQWRKHDGTILWVEETFRVVRDRNGKILFFEGTADDISRRKAMAGALEREKALFEQLFSGSPEAVVLCDNDGVILRINETFSRLFGYAEAEVLGESIDRLLTFSEDLNQQATSITKRVRQGEPAAAETTRRRKDGRIVHVSVLGQPILLDGRQVGVYGIYRDISARKAAENALHEAHAKVERLHEAAILLEHAETLAGVYRNTIDAAERILGYSRCALDVVVDGHLLTVATSSETPKDRFRRALVEEAGVAGRVFASAETVILDDPDPSELAEASAAAIRSLITTPLHDIGVFQAASDKKGAFSSANVRLLEILLRHTSAAIERLRLESELKEQATHDPLTGVFNRRYFNEVIEQETLRAKRYEHQIGLLMIDVNRFKEINDQRGHHVGDDVLQAIAGVLQQTVRETDLVVRYGGDEFLVVLTETGTDAEQVADRIRDSVMRNERLQRLAGSQVTVSVGTIAWNPESDTPIARVLALADERMYEEKRKR